MTIYDYFPDISNNMIFKGVPQEYIAKYLSDDNISICKFGAKETIISPKTCEVKIGIVVCGTVEVTSSSQTHKVLLKTSGRGTIFGVSNLYANNTKFPSFIRSKNGCEILFISPDAFKEMIESNKVLTCNFLEFLSKKIIYLNKKVTSYTAGNAEQKLAYFLCENEIDGVVCTDMSMSDIAVMLDMGRASLYRSFDSLESQGMIERSGRNIRITDRSKLKNIYITK